MGQTGQARPKCAGDSARYNPSSGSGTRSSQKLRFLGRHGSGRRARNVIGPGPWSDPATIMVI